MAGVNSCGRLFDADDGKPPRRLKAKALFDMTEGETLELVRGDDLWE